MTKVNIKKMNGFSGGLVVVNSFFFLLFLLSSCSQNIGTCEFEFKSLATGRVSNDIYTYSIEENDKGYSFVYQNIKDSSLVKYVINNETKELTIFRNSIIEEVAFVTGERIYKIEGNSIKTTCFRVNNEEVVGPNLLIFCNEDYGILLMNYTGFVRELIKLDIKGSLNNYALNLVRKIKEDSVFYRNGGQEFALPPKN